MQRGCACLGCLAYSNAFRATQLAAIVHHKKNRRRGGYWNAVADRLRQSSSFSAIPRRKPAAGIRRADGLWHGSTLQTTRSHDVAPPGSGELINRPKDAINVFEFEPLARKNVPPAHFGYMASGIDDEVTLRANREDFLKFQLMPRRLNDVSKVDTSIELFGTRYDSPIFVCPTGANQFFHPRRRACRGESRARRQSSASPLDVVELLRGRRCQGARRAGLVPALCVAELGRGAIADQARRQRRLSGPDGDGRSCRGPQPGNLIPPDAHRYARMFELPRSQQFCRTRGPAAQLRRHRPYRQSREVASPPT